MSEWKTEVPAPQSVTEDGWTVEVPSAKRKSTMLQQGAGVAQGMLDLIGAAPGALAGTALGIGDVLINQRDPRQALGAMEHLTQSMNPFNAIPSAAANRETEGYRYSPGTVAGEAIGTAMKGYGNLGGWLGVATGADPEQMDAAAQLGMAGTTMLMRGGRPKPGSPAAYREVADQAPTRGQIAESMENRKTYPDGWMDTGAKVSTTDVSVAGQMELPMKDPNIRSPYNLAPEEIARLEQEMNPPVEQRVNQQGELAFGQPDRVVTDNPRFVLEEGTTGARDRIASPEAERLQMDTPARVGEMEARVGSPEQAMGGMEAQRALPFRNTDDVGGMGMDALSGRERRQTERVQRQIDESKQDPIPYRPIGPKSQRGVIDPDLLTFGVSRLLREQGPRETIKKFVGTFSPDSVREALYNTRDPKSRETLVWMRPDDFHGLANTRGTLDPAYLEHIANPKYKGIKRGLSEAGLDSIPFLQIDSNGNVIGHEGRHRMDILKEQGIELVPVRLKTDMFRWGEREVHERPRVLNAEEHAADKSFSIPLPTLLRDQMKQQDILDKHRPMASQTGAVNLFGASKKDVATKGVARTFTDLKKLYTYDKRPLAQVVVDEGISEKTLTDLAPTDQALGSRLDRLLQKGMSNLAIDRTMAILSQNKGPIGKLIKWVVDNQNYINMNSKVRMEENTKAALDPWKKLKRTNEVELRQMLDSWLPMVGKEKLGPEHFKNARQYEVYKAVSDVFKAGWERTNELRAKSNLKPIDFVQNYFPALRQGDYWIHVIDKAGNVKWSSAYKTAGEAKRAHKVLDKEFGGEFEVKPVSLRSKGKYDLSSFAAFEETLRALSKDDPVKNQIQARYAELVGKRGFGKTGIMRKDVGGALGFEEGKLGVKNAEHVIETYITRQEAYLANLERAQLQKQLRTDIPAKVWDKVPLGKDYIDLYLEKSRGADLDAMPIIRDLAEAISTSAGFGRDMPRQMLKDTASVASLMWLGSVRFLMTQIPQHLAAMPKMVEAWQLGDKVTNPAKAYFDGWVEAFSPDVTSKEARKWALERGYLESTIVQLLEMRLSDLKGERWKVVGEAVRYGMGKVEQLAVRTPVFHMFERMMREQVPNKAERFELAANMMDYYMVHYDRESSPIVYDKAGLVGDAARPLKQYAHNAWGQFFEYAQTAKDQKMIAPLATYMGMQTLVGGMKGLILVAEATAIITVLNNMFGTDIPTPEQLMLEHGVSDMLVFGGYSTALGYDLSTSLSAPSLPSMMSMAPADFTTTAIKDMGSYLIKSIKGTATDQDAMKAMLAVSPSQARGWIEAYYAEPGKPIPKANDKMRGEFNAPAEDDVAGNIYRFGLGIKSLDEAKVNMTVRATKQLLARDVEHKLGTLDAIVDRVKNNEEIPEALLQKYMQEGGNMKQLPQSIRARIMELEMTWTDKNLAKKPSPDQIHRLEIMKKLMDEVEPAPKSPAKKIAHSVDAEGNIIRDPRSAFDMADFNVQRAEARRLHPGNIKKQIEWLELRKNMDARFESELNTFKKNMWRKQNQNNYTEM